MQNLKAIQAPILSEMKAFEPKFRDFMASKVALLDRITYYIVKRKGKQLRPMLVFLSAKLHGEIDESSYRGAALVELMHTATLVHDDVVLLLSVEYREHDLLELISIAVREMSEGELLQIEKARRLDIDEKVYFDIIKKKTASLIASCCAVGASSVKAKPEEIENMRLFGEYLGIAFQIKDDLFDFQSSGKAGKPTGIDIKEQKMTLPLIYALRNADRRDKKFMIRVVKRYNHDRKKVEQVMAMVRDSGGIEYAEKQMLEYQAKALTLLETYPASESKASLIALSEYVISRSK
jgi:octaprenyl-diphosphate synthase